MCVCGSFGSPSPNRNGTEHDDALAVCEIAGMSQMH